MFHKNKADVSRNLQFRLKKNFYLYIILIEKNPQSTLKHIHYILEQEVAAIRRCSLKKVFFSFG